MHLQRVAANKHSHIALANDYWIFSQNNRSCILLTLSRNSKSLQAPFFCNAVLCARDAVEQTKIAEFGFCAAFQNHWDCHSRHTIQCPHNWCVSERCERQTSTTTINKYTLKQRTIFNLCIAFYQISKQNKREISCLSAQQSVQSLHIFYL